MQRLHLLEDQPCCPVSLRDAATDYLQCSLRLTNAYAVILPRLQTALTRPDLLLNLINKYPNQGAFTALQRQVMPVAESVDVTAVPAELRGFCTMSSIFRRRSTQGFPPC